MKRTIALILCIALAFAFMTRESVTRTSRTLRSRQEQIERAAN